MFTSSDCVVNCCPTERRWDGLRETVPERPTGLAKKCSSAEWICFLLVCLLIYCCFKGPTIKHQPSSINHQASSINHQPSRKKAGRRDPNRSIHGMQGTLLAPQRSFKLSLIDHTFKTRVASRHAQSPSASPTAVDVD